MSVTNRHFARLMSPAVQLIKMLVYSKVKCAHNPEQHYSVLLARCSYWVNSPNIAPCFELDGPCPKTNLQSASRCIPSCNYSILHTTFTKTLFSKKLPSNSQSPCQVLFDLHSKTSLHKLQLYHQQQWHHYIIPGEMTATHCIKIG